MRAVTAGWIADVVGGELSGDRDVLVVSAHKDSRAVVPGGLYLAFAGERADGHDFVPQARDNGAVLSLVTRAVEGDHIVVDDVVAALGRLAAAYLSQLRADTGLTVVGITGSNGKTTTKDLLKQVLPDAVAPIGSYNNEIGLPLTVLEADETTHHLVLEMGAAAPGDIRYLTDIAPLDVAVILTVGSAHAQHYPTPEALAEEKASIIDGVVDGGTVILNADDPRVAAMAARAEERSLTVRTFGVDRGDVAATLPTLDAGRAVFDVLAAGEAASVRLSLVGEHHVGNALAALSVALVCGLSLADAAAAVSVAKPLSPHRMALTIRPDGVRILDDAYNASPESMRAALRALLAVAEGGFTWAVIGEMREMGDASWQAHSDIGHDAVRLNIGRLVVVGEGAKPAFDTAVREGSWGDEAVFVATIDEARELLTSQWQAGDTVLIKASNGSGLWRLADDLVAAD